MKLKRLVAVVAAVTVIGTFAAVSQIGEQAQASDHDDGETDLKSRALNLTDHFAFKTPVGTAPAASDKLALIMYFNPRSLPGRQYFLSPDARYEFHVTKVTGAKTAQAAPKDDYVFRFEASAPQANGTQFITMTVFRDNTVVGTHIGASTPFASSKTGTITTNNATIDAMPGFQYFVGMRTDSFFFDVNRFFQVRAFLAQRFFGGAAGAGDATASLAPNCEGDPFLGGILNPGSDLDGDSVNLFNPPTCAPDFTKNLNVTAIVLSVPKAFLGGGNVFDTWSSISVLQ
jgi:hypothetical protein